MLLFYTVSLHSFKSIAYFLKGRFEGGVETLKVDTFSVEQLILTKKSAELNVGETYVILFTLGEFLNPYGTRQFSFKNLRT